MPGPVSTFSIGLKAAIEESYSVAPAGSTNGDYFQGGKWMQIVTSDMPGLQDRSPLIFPSGHAGKRAMNQRQPVPGRRWSDGGFNYEAAADFMPMLLVGVLGSVSSNSVPSTDYTLLAASEITGGGTAQTHALTATPSDGGAILFFQILNATEGGTISVSGINSAGQSASELISFSSAGSFFTRTSFSMVQQFDTTYALDAASVAVFGYSYFEHTITPNNTSNPSLAIEEYGNPMAGAASKSFLYTGMLVQNVTWNNTAGDREGIFNGAVTFEGNPTATCDSGSLMAVSPVRIFPAWTQSLKKNAGAWNKVTNYSMTVNGGNRNYRAAAGTQNPQGAFYGGQEVTGSFEIQVSNEEEYYEWLGASQVNLISTWDSPWKLTSTQNQEIAASLLCYLIEPNKSDSDNEFRMSTDFRTIDDANLGIVKFKIINSVPGHAYSAYETPTP